MREQPVDTIEYRGFDINIYQDEMAEDPREWDNIGKMACTHRDYGLGDKAFRGKDGEEVVEKILAAVTDENKASSIRNVWDCGTGNSKKFNGFISAGLYIINKLAPVIMPLYLLDHSGLWMQTGRFGCDAQGWDTSMVGFIFCTYEDVKREYGDGPDAVERAEKYLRQEVEAYSQYLEGAVYGYVIEPMDDNRVACDDSCWGFYGYDWNKNGLKEMAENSVNCAIAKEKEVTRLLQQCWAY